MEKQFDSVPDAAENYRRFVQETGLDPRQDTDQILIALRRAEDGPDSGFLIIAQGRFDASRLVEEAAQKGGGTVQMVNGMKVWTSQTGSSGDADTRGGGSGRTVALAQPDGGTLLFGEKPEVMRVLDILSGKASPEPKDAKLRELLAGVDRRAPAWAVLNSSALAGKLSHEIGQSSRDWKPGSVLSKVESVTLMGWIGKDVDLKVRVSAKDSETAGLMADMVRGALAAGKLAAKDQDPDLLKILQETKLSQDGSMLELEARIPSSRFLAKQGAAGSM
jgi:hypothetical protein